jgi:phosphate transport system substrate-binding protein
MPDDWLWVLNKIYIVIGKNGIYVGCTPHRGDMPMSKRPALVRFSSYIVAATLLVAVIAASLPGSGCIGGGDGGAQQSMKLQIAGSTTVLPIAEECARIFMEGHPGDRVFVSGGGSSHGVKAVADGTMGIGTASRDLTDSEMEAHPDIVPHAIARDWIAIVVHPENPVDGLTMEELQGIYTGDITDWKDIGGKDSAIVAVSSEGIISDIVKFFNCGEDSGIMVVSREEGSGTRGYFEDAVIKSTGKEITDHAIIQDSNGKIRTTVAGDKHSIGFLSLGYASSDVKTVMLDGVAPSTENIRSGEYAISRTLLMITKGEPDEDEQAFLDFVLSEDGQKIVSDVHYIPVG